MQFKEDPKNLIVPLELTKIIYSEWDAEQTILDRPDQVYGKALHGTGKVKFKNGNNYEGDFHNGMLHGKGKFTWVSGVTYEGDFTYNKVSGVGTYSWSDGSLFTGSVLNGLRHGEGRFVAQGESAIYEGQWMLGLRHGLGKVMFKSGAYYEGNFHSGNKHGTGKMTYPSANFYDGTFNNDKKFGMGTMHWLTSSEKFYGQWQDNMQNGWGTHIWIEPKGEGSKFLRNRYEGEWENGERCGVGVFYYANGAKYIGEWHNNLKSGYAIFITDSGGIILGEFKSDRLSQVYATTENEQRSGILPREIAPKTREEQDVLQDQISKGNARQPSPGKAVSPTAKAVKVQVKDMTSTSKLMGINSPNNALNSGAGGGGLNKNQIEVNPYSYMIDLSDLFRGQSVDIPAIELNVQTILLRHNSTLKSWYKFFATKYEAQLSENTFSLNLEGFWRIIRDAKLLNANYSLAQLDRLYHNGTKNRFPLNYNQSLLRVQVESIKKFGKKLNLNDVDDLYHMDHSINIQEQLRTTKFDYERFPRDTAFDIPIVDLHEPTTILLFRQFVEMIVRTAYLKYGSTSELHRAIERIIVNKLTPLYERKKGKGLNASEDESRSTQQAKAKINFEDYIGDLQPLFERLCRNVQRPLMGYVDKTVELQDIFAMLEKMGMMADVDKTFIAAHIEKYFDPDEGSLNQLSQLDQSSMQQVAAKDDKPKRRKQKDQDTSHVGGEPKEREMKNLNKLEKWVTYLHNEFILYDFADIIITLLVRRNKDLMHPKEEEQQSRVRSTIAKLMNYTPKLKVKMQQPRLWPRTIKDQQKDELTNIRGQQEARAKQKKINEEERKREDRERNLMALEDMDFKSEDEDEGASEDSDY